MVDWSVGQQTNKFTGSCQTLQKHVFACFRHFHPSWWNLVLAVRYIIWCTQIDLSSDLPPKNWTPKMSKCLCTSYTCPSGVDFYKNLTLNPSRSSLHGGAAPSLGETKSNWISPNPSCVTKPKFQFLKSQTKDTLRRRSPRKLPPDSPNEAPDSWQHRESLSLMASISSIPSLSLAKLIL